VSSDSDFAQAVTSLGLPSGINVVVGAAGAVGLLLVSLAAAPAFLAFAPTAKEIDTAARRVAYVARIAVLPGVGGALLAVAFFLPDSGNGLIPALPLFGLFTLATLLAAPGTRSAAPDQLATAQRISWGLAATVVITFVILRFALARGIPIPPNPDSFFLP
jgi:cytochrome bd-type quinol oxidase subunit 2